jgi:hypothetical protein
MAGVLPCLLAAMDEAAMKSEAKWIMAGHSCFSIVRYSLTLGIATRLDSARLGSARVVLTFGIITIAGLHRPAVTNIPRQSLFLITRDGYRDVVRARECPCPQPLWVLDTHANMSRHN